MNILLVPNQAIHKQDKKLSLVEVGWLGKEVEDAATLLDAFASSLPVGVANDCFAQARGQG